MSAGRIPTTANSPLTTKGDLFTYSTSPARLAVGANGEQIVADSSASSGLRWTATPSASNPVLNSAFQIWQRGTSVAFGSYTYTADRWQAYNLPGVGTASQQVTGDTTNLPNIQYCARIQRTSGNSSTNAIQFSQSFETINSIQYAGKTVTLSFYARKGANYSPTSDILNTTLYYGTGTDQRVLAGYTGGTAAINQNTTLTSTWQRFSYSGAIASTATEIGMAFNFNPTGTAGANDYYEITGVQIDIGSVALPFRTYAATIQGELAACQRYYYRITGTNNFSNICPAYTDATNNAVTQMTVPVELRVAPTSVDFSNIRVTNFSGASAVTSASVSSAFNGKNNVAINLGVAGTPFTAFVSFNVSCNNNSAGYLGVSAEL